MDFKKIFESNKFTAVLITIGFFIILLLVFKAGEFVGYRKANFSFRWAENYRRNFGGPRGGFFQDLDNDGDYINSHGTFGSIIKIDGAMIIVKGLDNTEKTVLVSNATTIRKGRGDIKASDLKVDDNVTIIGAPNDQGQIEAKFIRVF